MIAAFGFCEEPEPRMIAAPTEVTGVHITRLTSAGGKAPEDKPKIMLGAMSGLPRWRRSMTVKGLRSQRGLRTG